MADTVVGGPLAVGVIGAGAMGTSHARMLARWVPAARVVGVYDVDGARAAEVAAEVGAKPVGGTQELIESSDAVVVASPDPTHEELALACIAAGTPVLCEKPLAVGVDGAARVVAAEQASGRALVQLGFMRRYDPAFVTLRSKVLAGQIGRPLVMHCVHRNPRPHPTATSEGIVSNSMIHELDSVPWLLDDPVTAISVRVPPAVERAGGLGDPQVGLLETAGGVLVTVEMFVSARYGYDVQCEVVGSDGTARLTAPAGVATRVAGLDRLEVTDDFVARFDDAYRIELGAWVAGVRRGVVDGPTARDGQRASIVAACGVEALRTGRRVEVPQ